jgi:EAL domain-containing protein (putative c-di-GMP-specific phosphodiesterase class I)
MNAATDDESIELDRLARMIHVINFFRQPEQQDSTIFIDVHDRLLTAVSSNHGAAFRRIVTGLGLPPSRIVLQLPYAKPSRSWALTQVVDNYKLNGFPLATRAANIEEALKQAESLRPQLIRLDISKIGNGEQLGKLIERTAALSVQLIFGRIEYDRELTLLNEAASQSSGSQSHLFIQGPLIGDPLSDLKNPTLKTFLNVNNSMPKVITSITP